MERPKKRSVFSMTEILNNLSTESEKNDNAFKLAVFNGIAIFLVIFAVVTICGVYFILQPFIKPLFWALLCGSALHPFKLAVATILRTQVVILESSSKPLYLNIICLPFSFILKISDALGEFLIRHLGLIIKFLGATTSVIACYIASVSRESSPCVKAEEKQEEAFPFGQAHSESQQIITSMTYIRWLFIVCVGVVLLSISSFPYIFVVMLTIYAIKQLCIYFGLIAIVNFRMEAIFASGYKWYLERQDIILPKPLKFTLFVLSKVRDRFFEGLKNCCDSAAAIAVILALLIFGTFVSVFFTIQAYKEGMYLVQTGGNIINSTIVHNPELQQMLPEDWQTTMDNALNDAYIYARDALTKLVRKLVADKGISEDKRAEIEKGALELWDRAYQAWVMPAQSAIGPTVTPDAVLSSCHKFIERLKKTPEVINWKSVRSFLQENMSTLSAGFDSVWLILKGNISLLLGILSTLFSMVFGGGLSLINFTLQSVVFLTALFYLLSSSRELYKPVEMVTQMSPKYGSNFCEKKNGSN
uniref:Transmembrane protein n=1 Tax=Rhodnius prolixus TaxID=13249 RepID=T1HAK7_RHOPR